MDGLVALISPAGAVFGNEDWEICMSKMKKNKMIAFNIFPLSSIGSSCIEKSLPPKSIISPNIGPF